MIFEYQDYNKPSQNSDNPYEKKCAYCNEKMYTLDIRNDYWKVSNKEILKTHHSENFDVFINYHGIETTHFDLNLNTKQEINYLDFCSSCGWWRILKQIDVDAKVHQYWSFFYGCSGTLKNLDITNIETPVELASKFLLAKYEDRFSINPRLFEEVVGSVFKNIGYHVHVTGYSNDGGIDIILGNSNQSFIGIQVKRYKNAIKVEQIRSFAGALLLNGYNNGIFVTTSDYQSGAHKTVEKYRDKSFAIELMNADKFYDALKITQKNTSNHEHLIEMIESNKIDKLNYYGFSHPNSSL